MNVLSIRPRGYCYGVVDAMVLALRTAQDASYPRPIYILGMIVHNAHVTEAFEREGVITLDGPDRLDILERITSGTVIFTAHGVSPEVRARARAKGLAIVDATCPDVTKTHDIILQKVRDGYAVVYIGKRGHPEPEGVLGVAPHAVVLVESESDIDALPDRFLDVPLIVTNQTTMSQWDVHGLVERVRARFPHVEVHNEICLATQVRQEAVASQAREADLVVVVGDPRSNNSNRLVQVAEEIAGVPAVRVASVLDIDPAWLTDVQTVAVTSGASTPTLITNEVIAYLERFDPRDATTWTPVRTINMDKILPKSNPKHVSVREQ
ncbi:MAG: 4-hydroxy-3-methylbut-2-enyl diphosphate reductase [Paenibacillaceae bacterium]|jgi:4-hydroxy-3-methylbut-2-enyl diphosphate reductase|nr:4-hydroxy-3-methylbut-2-enyl diphosphate reductase [Paenibacillaceae bacterium]